MSNSKFHIEESGIKTSVEERARNLFTELDVYGKGSLTKQEFIDAYLKR